MTICTGCLQEGRTIGTHLPRSFKQLKNIQKSGGNLCVECWIQAFEVVPDVATRIRLGESIHTCNCNTCRRTNRIYCSKCDFRRCMTKF